MSQSSDWFTSEAREEGLNILSTSMLTFRIFQWHLTLRQLGYSEEKQQISDHRARATCTCSLGVVKTLVLINAHLSFIMSLEKEHCELPAALKKCLSLWYCAKTDSERLAVLLLVRTAWAIFIHVYTCMHDPRGGLEKLTCVVHYTHVPVFCACDYRWLRWYEMKKCVQLPEDRYLILWDLLLSTGSWHQVVMHVQNSSLCWNRWMFYVYDYITVYSSESEDEEQSYHQVAIAILSCYCTDAELVWSVASTVQP